MRNSENYIITTGSEPLATDDETTWSFPGAIIGFVSGCWRLASRFLCMAVIRCSSSSTPAFLPALMPVAVVVGIALHSLFNGRLLYSAVFTIAAVVIIFGLLFLWLMG